MGGSTCRTRLTSSTWMPRAATSVQTSTPMVPSRNSARMRVRWFCRLPPCRPPARTPTRASCFTRRSTPCWVRTNMIVRPSRLAISAVMANLSSRVTWSTWCSIVTTDEVAGSSECVTGSLRKRRTSLSTSPSRVAENSRRWLSEGVCSSRALTTGKKPRSHMWSASSITVTRTSSSEHSPCWMRSVSRPGVATTISTPRRRASICLPMDMPPTTVFMRRYRPRPRGSRASVTCIASSRVGTRTTASGRRGAALVPATRAMVGRPNARVLPEPVWPRPSTWRPERMSGMVARWMGNGLAMPWRARPVTRGLGRPRRVNSDGPAGVSPVVASAEPAGAAVTGPVLPDTAWSGSAVGAASSCPAPVRALAGMAALMLVTICRAFRSKRHGTSLLRKDEPGRTACAVPEHMGVRGDAEWCVHRDTRAPLIMGDTESNPTWSGRDQAGAASVRRSSAGHGRTTVEQGPGETPVERHAQNPADGTPSRR